MARRRSKTQRGRPGEYGRGKKKRCQQKGPSIPKSPTPNQKDVLKRHGLPIPTGSTEATQLLNRLQRNGWKVDGDTKALAAKMVSRDASNQGKPRRQQVKPAKNPNPRDMKPNQRPDWPFVELRCRQCGRHEQMDRQRWEQSTHEPCSHCGAAMLASTRHAQAEFASLGHQLDTTLATER